MAETPCLVCRDAIPWDPAVSGPPMVCERCFDAFDRGRQSGWSEAIGFLRGTAAHSVRLPEVRDACCIAAAVLKEVRGGR